jgi:hypothetical protein
MGVISFVVSNVLSFACWFVLRDAFVFTFAEKRKSEFLSRDIARFPDLGIGTAV